MESLDDYISQWLGRVVVKTKPDEDGDVKNLK